MGAFLSRFPDVSPEDFLKAFNRVSSCKYKKEVLFFADGEDARSGSYAMMYSADVKAAASEDSLFGCGACKRDSAAEDMYTPTMDNKTMLNFLANNVNWIERDPNHDTVRDFSLHFYYDPLCSDESMGVLTRTHPFMPRLGTWLQDTKWTTSTTRAILSRST